MPHFKSWSQEDFRFRLRLSMQVRKMSQCELARRLNVSQPTVSRWQSNPANYPGLDHLYAAAQILDVPVCWLAFACPHHFPQKCKRLLRQLKRDIKARDPIAWLEHEKEGSNSPFTWQETVKKI